MWSTKPACDPSEEFLHVIFGIMKQLSGDKRAVAAPAEDDADSWRPRFSGQVLRKKLSRRDENRHLDVKKEIMYSEGLMAVKARLKRGKIRYVQMPAELAAEVRRHPAVTGEERILPPPPNRARRADGRAWKTVSTNCSDGRRFEVSVSTICATPSRPGT